MTFDFFSPTQLKALSWWSDASPYRDLDAVICDGAVRSGKMHELIEYITEYRLRYVKMLIDNLQPDVIFSHDDWGTKDALFMKPLNTVFQEICRHEMLGVFSADKYLNLENLQKSS